MARRSRQPGLFAPWERYRKWFLGFSLVVLVLSIILVNMPTGIGFFLLSLLVSTYIWRPIYVIDANPYLGTYTPSTLPYRVSKFMMVYAQKVKSREIFSPTLLLSFGPPREDSDHNIVPGWVPPFRLSSFWAVFLALSFGAIDILINPVVHMLGNDLRLHWAIAYPLSAIGWYTLFQGIADTFRTMDTTDAGRVIATEPRPATMLHIAWRDVQEGWAKFAWKVTFIGNVLSLIVIVLLVTARAPIHLYIILLSIFWLLPTLISISWKLMKAYSSKWTERNDRRKFWEGVLMPLRTPPIFLHETSLPSLEEWEQEGHPEDEPYDPSVNVAIMQFPPGMTFNDYRGIEDTIAGSLKAETVAVAPLGRVDEETGQEVPGTIGKQMFRIWYSEKPMSMDDLLNPSINKWERELGARSFIQSAIANARGIGSVDVISVSPMTRASSKARIIQVTVVPANENVTLSQFLGAIQGLQQSLKVEWVRAYRPGNSREITLMLGDDPDKHDVIYSHPPRTARKTIDDANWAYYNYSVGIVGGDGNTPKFVQRRKATSMVDELQFELPAGMNFKAIKGSLDTLKTTSGMSFMEASLGITNDKGEFEKSSEQSGNAKYTIIAARKDPLARIFGFGEYKDRTLTGREPGKIKLDWFPGVLSNDRLAKDSFDTESCHLLIAGSSGSGKSVVVQNMLAQIAYNNAPTEVNFWLLEPKIGLQRFKELDVTTRFCDSWSLDGVERDGTFMEDAASMASDLIKEMKRRNKILAKYKTPDGATPEKISEAREIVQDEIDRGIWDESERANHPLNFPVILFVVEECASVYQGAISKDDAAFQNEFNSNMTQLAREARSSGIYIINLTQYPTNASIPSTIRQQMRRIGLKCKNSMASRVVIDENGLELLTGKGAGLISEDGVTYRQFRGLLLRNGRISKGEPNDLVDTLGQIPKNSMFSSEHTNDNDSEEHSFYELPDIDSSVFGQWASSSRATVLERAIDNEIETKPDKGALVVD